MNPLEKLAEGAGHLKASLDPAIVIGSDGAGLTTYILWMCITLTITMIVVLVAAKKLQLVPSKKFAGGVEYIYDVVRRNMGENAIGEGYEKHLPFLATLFFFILISNFVGLIPGCKTPTGTLGVTWALALVSFIYFNYYGVKAHGGLGYIKSIAPSGLPKVMVPIIWFFEFISLCLRLLTLAVRLYGNMFAGHMVLGIFSLATSIFITAAIQEMSIVYGLITPLWFIMLCLMYALECLVAFLQAYVFTILSAAYISLATSSH